MERDATNPASSPDNVNTDGAKNPQHPDWTKIRFAEIDRKDEFLRGFSSLDRRVRQINCLYLDAQASGVLVPTEDGAKLEGECRDLVEALQRARENRGAKGWMLSKADYALFRPDHKWEPEFCKLSLLDYDHNPRRRISTRGL